MPNQFLGLASTVLFGAMIVVPIACDKPPVQPAPKPDDPVFKKTSLNQCDVDIHPLTRKDDKLDVGYYAGDAVHDLVLTSSSSKPVGVYVGATKICTLEKNVAEPVKLHWVAGDENDYPTLEITAEATTKTNIPTDGSYVLNEPNSSPCFEDEKAGDWMAIRCQYKGRTKTLRLKVL